VTIIHFTAEDAEDTEEKTYRFFLCVLGVLCGKQLSGE
jgi:hypothetical protein